MFICLVIVLVVIYINIGVILGIFVYKLVDIDF